MNHIEELFNQSRIYFEQNQHEKAFDFTLQAANLGHILAMNNLSFFYDVGCGTTVDHEAAFYWLKNAAENGYQSAYYPMACRYYHGNGIEPDLNQAIFWAEKATKIEDENQQNAQNLLRELQQMVFQNTMPSSQSSLRINYAVDCTSQGRFDEAFQIFLEEAQNQIPIAMYNLTRCYDNGHGTPVDPEQGAYWLKAAAEHGYEPAYYLLACRYYYGNGIEPDLNQAIFWAEKATKIEDENQAQAQTLFEELTTIQRSNARVNAAVDFINQGHFDEAFPIILEEAENGNPLAMYNLSICYDNGNGTPVDFEKGTFWLKESAENGYYYAYYLLAYRYYSGKGTPVDFEQAAFWAEKACEIEDEYQEQAQNMVNELRPFIQSNSQINQGLEYINQNRPDEAFQIFWEESQKQIPIAMYYLAACYDNGFGTPMNAELASHWLKAAAEKDYVPAFYLIALRFYYGNGIPVDFEQATFWAEKTYEADESNRQEAQELLKKIQSRQQAAQTSRFNEALQLYQNKQFDQAFKIFLEEAKNGLPAALYNTYICYREGRGVTKDPFEAFKWLQKAAEAQFPRAYLCMAIAYLNGNETTADLNQAQYWAKKALELSPQDAAATQNILKRIQWIEKGKTLSFSPEITAAKNKGTALYSQEKYAEALPLLEKAARAGHPGALHTIGLAYYYGKGVKQNNDAAFRFFQEAIYRGNYGSLLFITSMFSEAFSCIIWKMYAQYHQIQSGTPYDQELTQRYQKLHNQTPENYIGPFTPDAKSAMICAAKCYGDHQWQCGHNEYKIQNIFDTAHYFRSATLYGNMDGLCGLAKESNPDFMMRYYKLAAYMGHSYAMFMLAQQYERHGDPVAVECYKTAAKWGYAPAINWCNRNQVTY